MLKKMGNQNATAITEEEKAADEATGNPSIEENQTRNDQMNLADKTQEEDQILDHIDEKDENDEGREVNSVEPNSDEIQEIKIPASDIKDNDLEDQEAKDTTLNSTAEVSHESYALANLDAKEDDHVLERIKEDSSLHVSEESNGKLCSRIDEIADRATEEEEDGNLMIETISEIQEEKVINAVFISELKLSTSRKNLIEEEKRNQDIGEHEIASQMQSNDEEIVREQIEVVKDTNNQDDDDDDEEEEEEEEKFYESARKSEESEIEARSSDHEADFKDLEMVNTKDSPDSNLPNGSLDVERYDHNDTNNQDSSHGSDDDDDEEHEKFFESARKSEETEIDAKSSDHEADFKDVEMVNTKDSPDTNLPNGILNVEENDHDNDFFFKDQNQPKLENSGNETMIESNKTQSQINKSPSFNFEFKNSVTKTDESDQTPLLYNNNKANKAPMRSLSTPATARFNTSTLEDESEDQERTINTVDYDQRPRTPLNGLLKDEEEEIHLAKPQKIKQQTQNIGTQKDQKRNKSSRNLSSYLFSSCICCSGVQELSDS